MNCIMCGACVSDCTVAGGRHEFLGPAALAKAYRFVGDPRDATTRERLLRMLSEPHGIWDCTRCNMCVEVCPKDVTPMDQIMHLRARRRRSARSPTRTTATRHTIAFVKIIEKTGTPRRVAAAPGVLRTAGSRASCIPKSGAIKGLVGSLPTAIRVIKTGKMRSLPKLIPGDPPQAARRRPGPRQADLRARRGSPRGAQPLHRR